MHLFLFDIDGTLIDTSGAGRAALELAVSEEFGVATPHRVNLSGRTDRGIAREYFEVHRIEATEENFARLIGAYLSRLSAGLPARPGRVLPGAAELVRRLAELPNTALGLLTGNVKAGAMTKLRYFGLAEYFDFGGFGDLHADRNQVAEEALAAAKQKAAAAFAQDRVYVVGDTPLDIRCARWIGARAVAVATGMHPLEELAEHQPDLLLPDLVGGEALLALCR